MKEEFYNYLLDFGYKETTLTRRPSTIPQYVNAIDKIVRWECLENWEQLIPHFPILLKKYETSGEKAHLVARGHRTIINALKSFVDFIYLQIEIYSKEF